MDYRNPKGTLKRYKKYQQNVKAKKTKCVFCVFNELDNVIIERTKLFTIVENKFPYEIWDGYQVAEHLMIVPLRHVDTISDFNTNELREYVSLLAKYEGKGFSVYARSANNQRKTVEHEHTHLISLEESKPIKWLFNRRSKILWFK